MAEHATELNDALTIPCPACKRPAGEKCHTVVDGTDTGWTHDARHEAYSGFVMAPWSDDDPDAGPTPERGDVSSEPTAEGLTEADRLLEVIHAEAHAAERCGKECELWRRLSRLPRHPIDAWIAARLAAVQAERESTLRAQEVDYRAHIRDIKAERDDLRAALDRVKAEHRQPTVLLNRSDLVLAYERTRAAVEGGRS